MSIMVREAGIVDAELIASLTRAAWAGKVPVTSSGHRETAQRVRDELRSGGAFILLLDGTPVGSVRFAPHDEDSATWEIRRMGVLPHCRGRNLSQHLLEAVIHHALASNTHELRLAVRSDQPRLLDLYAAYAFELAEELDYSHTNPAEPAPRVMRRYLDH
ncbi:GNAT family N-acetyltransferase [Massilia sp. PAMC28688]|uniref:GNAT family N-acetyltransferase n=1 Tax=Massilia sp. PAMC28688 TaxID=2861283 RepID=UPI001C626174|nr:GNAT family N-acetyltransferase [Massilia sp. PAMC28688]QYF92502.1 GNAT family N-acetyltransferase [Massilia sp. PAMC28688]